MGRSKKHQRLVDLYFDDSEEELCFSAGNPAQFYKGANSAPSVGFTYAYSRNSPGPAGYAGPTGATGPNMRTEPMKPRNPVQQEYIKSIYNPSNSIIIASGPAGTGKSCIAVSSAIELLKKNAYEKIVITRPAVAVEEEHGFLPGSIEDKLDPWVRPLYDTFYKYYSPEKVKAMTLNRTIDICPLAYLRGRTLENSFIIVDEAQNCSVKQMLMVMTRIGSGSKMIITGDPSQHDRGREKSGLTDLIERLYKNDEEHYYDEDDHEDQEDQEDHEERNKDEHQSSSGIVHIKFSAEHIERHPVIKHVLNLYK